MAFQGEIGRASVVVEADVSQFARGLAGLKSFVAQQTAAFGQATASTAKFNSTLSLAAGGVGVLTGALGGLAAAFSAREILSWINAFQNVENSMRSAGVATEDLSATTKELFDVAVATRAPVETMGQLYTQLTIQTKELGLAQKDIFSLMKLVGQGIAVSGTSAESARGALLQFGQMLGTSRVRMQEFNSVQMGAPALLRAAAAGIDRAGGSVARLRELVTAGKLSNQDFYQGLLKGSTTITEPFAKMVPTLAQAGTVFRDALIEISGRTDEAAGGTRALAQAVTDLAAAMRSPEFQDFLKGTVDNLEGMGAEAKRDIDTMRRLFDARQTHDFATVMKEVWKLVEPQPLVNRRIQEITDAITALGKRSAELKAKGSLVPTERIELAQIPKRIKDLQDQLAAEGGPPPSKFQGPTRTTQLAAGIGRPTPGLTAQDARAAEAVTKQVEDLRNKLVLAKVPAGELHDFLKGLGAGVDLSLVVDEAGNIKDAFKDTVAEGLALGKALKDVQTPEGLAASLEAVSAELTKLRTEYDGATGAAKQMLALKIGDLEAQQLKLVQAQAKALAQQYRDVFAAKKAALLAAAAPEKFAVSFDDTEIGRANKLVSDLAAELARMQASGAFDVEVRLKTEELRQAQNELQAAVDKLQASLAREPALRVNTQKLEAAKQELADFEAKLEDLQQAGVDTGDIRMRIVIEGIEAARAKLQTLGAERDRLLKAQPTTSPEIEAAKAKIADLAEALSRLKASGGLDAEITAKTAELDAATQKLKTLRGDAAAPIEINLSPEEMKRQSDQLQAALAGIFQSFENQSGITFGEFRKQLEAVAATAPVAIKAKLLEIIASLQDVSAQTVVTAADLKRLLETGLSPEQVDRFSAALAAAKDQLDVAKAAAGSAGDAIRETAAAARILSEILKRPITITMFKDLEAAGDAGAKRAREIAHIQAQAAAAAGSSGGAAARKAPETTDLERQIALLKLKGSLGDEEAARLARQAELQDEITKLVQERAESGHPLPAADEAGLRQAADRLSVQEAESTEIGHQIELLRLRAGLGDDEAASLARQKELQEEINKIVAERAAAGHPVSAADEAELRRQADLTTAREHETAELDSQIALLRLKGELGDDESARLAREKELQQEITRVIAERARTGHPVSPEEEAALRKRASDETAPGAAERKANEARVAEGEALPDRIDAANVAAQELSTTLTDIDNLSFDSLKESFRSIAERIAQMIIQALLFKAIMAAVGTPGAPAAGGSTANPAAGGGGGGMFGFARGGAIDRSRIIPAAHGMVLHKPTLIPLASGDTVLAREAGPEAILPLGRTAGGDLGVKTIGSRGAQQGQTMAGDTLNFDFRGMSQGAVADAMNQVYAAARRDVFKELSRSPTSRRSIGLRGGVR